MKLLINGGCLKSSGVCQVARSFLKECISFPENEYHVFVSPTLENELRGITFPPNFQFYLFDKHPLYSLFGSPPFRILKRYHALTGEIDPDCVFSVFGPAWWKSGYPTLSGYASPQFIFEESPFFRKIGFKDKLKLKISKMLFCFALKRETRYYVVETEITRERLSRLLHIPLSDIFVVSNTCSDKYHDFVPGKKLLPEKAENEFRMFIPALTQPHKNQVILNEVIPLLNNNTGLHKQIVFVTTLPRDFLNSVFTEEAKRSIMNLDRIPAEQCPQAYSECDALFYPTLLECFSASYPEAMQMGKPILTSDLAFATDTCRDAALYFDPTDAADIVRQIVRLVQDEKLQDELIRRGKKRLSAFLNARQRTQKYLELCRLVISQSKG